MTDQEVLAQVLALLADRPIMRERVMGALHIEADVTGAGKPHLNMSQGGLLFQWHPAAQKVYWLKPVFKDGKQTHFSGQLIATDMVTHGHAISAMLIWKRGYDEGSRPDSRAAMNEGKDG